MSKDSKQEKMAVPITRPDFNPSAYEEESASSKLSRKSKDAPFMPLGIAGGIASLLYGAYKYKNRGKMSTSVYLIQMRVVAQGTIVAALSIGVAYTLLRDYVFTSDSPERKDQ